MEAPVIERKKVNTVLPVDLIERMHRQARREQRALSKIHERALERYLDEQSRESAASVAS